MCVQLPEYRLFPYTTLFRALAVPQSAAPLNAGAHGFRSPVDAQYGTPRPGLHAVDLCALEPLRCGAPALGGTPLPCGGTGRGASVERAHGEQRSEERRVGE